MLFLFSALSGELPPFCDLPWEFNSGCDQIRRESAHTTIRLAGCWLICQSLFFLPQLKTRRGEGAQRGDYVQQRHPGGEEIISSSSPQTKASLNALNLSTKTTMSDTLIPGDSSSERISQNY